MLAKPHRRRHLPLFFAQRDGLGVARQSVVVRTIKTGEGFQLVQRARCLERFGIQLDGVVRGVATGAAAGILFGVLRVWGAVGAEEEFFVAAGGGFHQCFAVCLAFQDRQAVEVRADAADQHGVAVVEQVLRGEGGGDGVGCCGHELRGIFGGDVLEHDAQAGQVFQQGCMTRSMNTASRSKMSMSALVTSPCTRKGIPQRCISSSAA